MKKLKQENARIFKWKEMLESYTSTHNRKIKERARKGIPDSIRGFAWITLSQSQKYINGDKVQYFKELMT